VSRSIRHGSSRRALRDLRYGDAEIARASSERRRPMPSLVSAKTDNPCSKGRCGDFKLINSAYAAAQSRVRVQARDVLREARKALSAGADPDEVDLPEFRNGRRRAW